MRGAAAFASIALVACSATPSTSDAGRTDAGPLPPLEVPVVQVGLDAYRAWERWPVLRLGTRTIMRSTYDRTGGNDASDAAHFLRGDASDRWVTIEAAGPGALVFARSNHWHGSPWHYEIDDTDVVVSETSTVDPDHPTDPSSFVPASVFAPPLAVTWSVTRGADLSWVPLAFERSFVLAYGRTFYGTGYDIVQRFPEGADNLSRPIATFDGMPADPAAAALLARAGEDLAPTDATRIRGTIDLAPDHDALVATIDGPAVIRALRISVDAAHAIALGRAHLRVRWDDRDMPSIDAPIALFFGAGTLYDRDGREWLVRALPVSIRRTTSVVELGASWPMPFFRRARVEITGAGEPIAGVTWELATVPLVDPPEHQGYFHASYVDQGVPVAGEDLVLLDTQGIEGTPSWCGHVVGTSFVFSETATLWTLEGDPRFYFDGSRSPQALGTGTEEWGGGGDYWGGLNMTLPLAGHPVGAPAGMATEAEDAIESAYRFLLADAFPFGDRALLRLEHGGTDDSSEHYRTVALWYGRPSSCLVSTDVLDVGDAASEAAHAYSSPDASAVVVVTSAWDGGPLAEPTSTEDGRTTSTRSEFELAIDPRNAGVLLRRTLDYALADQRADVYVADANDPSSAFERAGTWLTSGSTRSVYAPAETELGAAEPMLEDSMRQLRDDEFLIAPRFTRGRSRLRVRIEVTSSPHPLLPGMPPPPSGWSELRYEAFVWTLLPLP